MLSFINFQDHPTNRNKKVFYFHDEAHAKYFENLLKENDILFEQQVDTQGDNRIYYGVHIANFKNAKNLNYLTIGAFRKPFIADKFFRYFVIAISILILTLAIVGALLAD